MTAAARALTGTRAELNAMRFGTGEIVFATDENRILVADTLGAVSGLGSSVLRGDFETDSFLGLSDVDPTTYSGQAGKVVKVNSGETGLEFGADAVVDNFLALTDTPSSFSGETLKSVRVNAGETALEFFTPTAGISGSGTTGTLPKFTGASAVGDSLWSESGVQMTLGGTDSQILVRTGTTAIPAYSFIDDTDTGFVLQAIGRVDMIEGGNTRVRMGDLGGGRTGITTGTGSVFSVLAGTAAAPALIYGGVDNSGLYSPGASQISMASGGAQATLWNASQQTLIPTGEPSPGEARLGFIGDTDTGIKQTGGADTLTIAAGGQDVLVGNATGQALFTVNATATVPSLSFSGDANTGLGSNTADTLNMVTAGTIAFTVNSTQQTQHVDGAEGAPSIGFISEGDIGLYLSGAEFHIDTGGLASTAERIRFGNGTGFLGIGTADNSPAYALDIQDDDAVVIRVQHDEAAIADSIYLYNADANDNNGMAIALTTDTTGAGATAETVLAQIQMETVVHDHATRQGSVKLATSNSGAPAIMLNIEGASIGFFGQTPTAQSSAYTRNATIVEDRTLLASASATTTNNNNVLAALIADLQALGLLG